MKILTTMSQLILCKNNVVLWLQSNLLFEYWRIDKFILDQNHIALSFCPCNSKSCYSWHPQQQIESPESRIEWGRVLIQSFLLDLVGLLFNSTSNETVTMIQHHTSFIVRLLQPVQSIPQVNGSIVWLGIDILLFTTLWICAPWQWPNMWLK